MSSREKTITHTILPHPGIGTSPSMWSLGYLSLLLCTGISAILVLFYLYITKPYVLLPADILTWAETCFVGDIIKLRVGTPIYTPPEDSNCNVYAPGAQLLTYAISWIVGQDTSIPAWRVIQISFVFCGALIATVCCRILNGLAFPGKRMSFPKTWTVFTFLAMFLAATAPVVNANSHTLQSDALVLLVSMFCFLRMLVYCRTPNYRNVIMMSVCPALGYFVKQNLMAWTILMFVVMVLHENRNYRHLILFVLLASLSILATIGMCYMLWGDSFIFWTFEIMGGPRSKLSLSPGSLNISLARSMDHVLRAWMEIGIGVVGGLFLLRGRNVRKLGPVWVAWVMLICCQAVTSGINWGPLYHFGPGIVIGTVWLFAALPELWSPTRAQEVSESSQVIHQWIRPVIAVLGIVTVFVALRVVPTGDRSEPRYWKRSSLSDVYRHVADIEREFEGTPADKILLDVGNWIYLRHSVVAKDRAVSLADQPPSGIYENFDVMVDRIHRKTYSKILVHNLHSPYFFYDWFAWERSTGVREALLEHYEEVRTIPAAEGSDRPIRRRMQTGRISVLVPKSSG